MRDLNREVHLEKFRQKREFLNEWDKQQRENWQKTIDVQTRREATEVDFERKRIIKEQMKIIKLRKDTAEEVMTSTCNFDSALGYSTLETSEEGVDTRLLLSQASVVTSQNQLLSTLESKLNECVLDTGIVNRLHQSNATGNVQR